MKAMNPPDQNGVWVELEDLRDTASPAVQEIVSKRFFGKRKKGEITPHSEFFPTKPHRTRSPRHES